MKARFAIAALAACGLAATACSAADATSSTTPTPTKSDCVARAGGRCPGPAPVTSALIGSLYIASPTQLDLFGKFQCGGRLRAKESGNRVLVTYIASRVPPGAMMCASVTLSVGLHRPLLDRSVVDSLTGHVLHVGVLPNA